MNKKRIHFVFAFEPIESLINFPLQSVNIDLRSRTVSAKNKRTGKFWTSEKIDRRGER